MKAAWVFDVDGVITDIEKEIVTEPFILDFIIKILEKGEPVALNTGRGIDWTRETVLNPLVNKIPNKNILKNLFIVAESGGVIALFNQDGSLDVQTDDSLKMPVDIDNKVKKLLQDKYSKTMRYENKKTMTTTKIKEGTFIDDFIKDQKEIAKDLQRLIDIYKLNDKFKVDVSTIGTSIMHINTGKNRGAELIMEWLKKKKIKPQRFAAFGDSLSDFPMAEKLYESGHNVELVYVGKKDLPKKDYPFKITKTQNLYCQGTLEFLKGI